MSKIEKHKLANGITLLNNFDATTQMVALNLLYDVGSKDETPATTGMAHLLEHLMFTGSKNAENFDYELQQAGGINNAWTNKDVTNYYDILPAQNVETALWLESDRLLDLSLSQAGIDTQKSVVVEEFKQRCLNVPYGDLSHLTDGLSFEKHPYRWPVIGLSADDIFGFSTDDIHSFRERNYSPHKLIICLSGNCEFSRSVELVEKWFGDIPAHDVPERNLLPEPKQCEHRQMNHHNVNVPHDVIVRAYHMCGRRDLKYHATDLLSDVFANGQSSRFYQNLVCKSKKFAEADASITGTIDPGLFLIRATLADGVSYDEATSLIDEEINKVKDGLVTDYEVRKCANKSVATEMYQNCDYKSVAERACYFELLGDANMEEADFASRFAVSKEDVVGVAAEILKPENCSTIFYGPNA